MYLEKSVYVLVVDNNTEQLFIGDTREDVKSAFEDYVSKNLDKFLPFDTSPVFISVAWSDEGGCVWIDYLNDEEISCETDFDFRILPTDVITTNN